MIDKDEAVDRGMDDAVDGVEADEGSDRRSLSLLQLLPNLVTLLGLCAGLTSIRYVLGERYEIAAALIILLPSIA